MSTHSAADEDSGAALIEVIVAFLISGIILIAIAAVFFFSLSAQQGVARMTGATANGQLVGAAVERAVRNALYMEVSADGNELRVLTSLGGGLKCQGFRAIAVEPGRLQMISSANPLPPPQDWPDWQTGVLPQSEADFFTRPALDVIEYAFEIRTETAPVRISGEVLTRSTLRGDSDSCW